MSDCMWELDCNIQHYLGVLYKVTSHCIFHMRVFYKMQEYFAVAFCSFLDIGVFYKILCEFPFLVPVSPFLASEASSNIGYRILLVLI